MKENALDHICPKVKYKEVFGNFNRFLKRHNLKSTINGVAPIKPVKKTGGDLKCVNL